MPECTADELDFGRLGHRVIEANFEGGALSSDGGLMLARQVDRRIGLSAAVADALHDPRDPDRITHALRDLVAQRLYGLVCGYEDVNDHARLRSDPLMQTAVGKDTELGSSPTLSRLETRATRADIVALNRVLVEQFIASHAAPPSELVLDADASDIPCTASRSSASSTPTTTTTATCRCMSTVAARCWPACCASSRIDGARHAAAVIKLLVTRLREAWPDVRIIVRGDSGFCRQRLIRWCERHGVGYVIGVARNTRLHKIVEGWEGELERPSSEMAPSSA
jgi:hypothetical protein